MGLHSIDIAVLGLYLLAMTGIGFVTARKIKKSSDFFMPRKFGKLFMVTFAFGAGTHSDQAVGVAAKSYVSGLSGIWYQWLYLPATPFYWLIAPVMRRFRAITTGDVFEARYNTSVAVLFAIFGMMNLAVSMGVMLKGAGAVISACTGGVLDPNLIILLMTVVFVLYGVAGGLSAAIITDFIQGILTIIFSFLLLPMILNAIGGMDGLRQGLSDPNFMSLIPPKDINLFYILIIAFNALVGIVVQPHTMGACAAGKTEYEGRFGFMYGNLLKRLCTIPWCLTGIAAVVYFSQTGQIVEPDHVFGTVAGDFLPKIMPGVLGIFIAALLASVMSTCDAFMISSSALFTENIYRKFRPNKDQQHYITIGRIASIIVVAGGIGFAFWLESVVTGLEIFWMVSAMMGVAFWLGLFFRRTTVAGAWAATLGSFLTMLFTSEITIGGLVLWDFNSVAAGKLPAFLLSPDGTLNLPWQMICYLTAGLVAGIVVSLITKPVEEKKLQHFYALTRTPVIPGEQVDVACTLPDEAVVPPRKNLIPAGNWEIPVPSKQTIQGFMAGWLCVAVIVAIVVAITKI